MARSPNGRGVDRDVAAEQRVGGIGRGADAELGEHARELADEVVGRAHEAVAEREQLVELAVQAGGRRGRRRRRRWRVGRRRGGLRRGGLRPRRRGRRDRHRRHAVEGRRRRRRVRAGGPVPRGRQRRRAAWRRRDRRVLLRRVGHGRPAALGRVAVELPAAADRLQLPLELLELALELTQCGRDVALHGFRLGLLAKGSEVSDVALHCARAYSCPESDRRQPPRISTAAPSSPRVVRYPPRISTAISATCVGVRPTRTPLASSASALAAAVPLEPLTIAPAWPMVLPGGAVNPAM